MDIPKKLFANNQAWAARMVQRDPHFFARFAQQQAPPCLWVGCSDSRVPPNQIVALPPGELFVHRNVANVVAHTDLNCLSVLQYAVEVLRVRHIIVCGHYGCGGVQAAVRNERSGLIDNWLRPVREIRQKHGAWLDKMIDESEVIDRLCELNVIEQVLNVSRTTVVEDAWWHGQSLTLYGWIYNLKDGRLRDLGMCAGRKEEVAQSYSAAVQGLGKPTADREAAPKLSTSPPQPSPRQEVQPQQVEKPRPEQPAPATQPPSSRSPQPPPLPRLK